MKSIMMLNKNVVLPLFALLLLSQVAFSQEVDIVRNVDDKPIEQILVDGADLNRLTFKLERSGSKKFKGNKATLGLYNGARSFAEMVSIRDAGFFNQSNVDLTTEFQVLLKGVQDGIYELRLIIDDQECMKVPLALAGAPDETRQVVDVSAYECSEINLDFLKDHTCQASEVDPTNFFGENAYVFPRNKVVYVLDFQSKLKSESFLTADQKQQQEQADQGIYQPQNQFSTEQEFYKIYRSKDGKRRLSSESKLGSWKIPNTVNDYLMITRPSMGDERLNAKDNVQLKIHNINLFRYNAAISAENVLFESQQGTLFTRFFSADSELLGTLIDQVGPSSSAASAVNSKSSMTNLQNEVKCFRNKWIEIRTFFYKVYNQCQRFPCCGESKLGDALLKLGDLLGKINSDLDILLLKARQDQAELKSLKAVCQTLNEVKELEAKKAKLEAEIAELKKDKKDTKAKEEALAEVVKGIKEKQTATKDKKCEEARIKELEKAIKPYEQLIYIRDNMPSESDFKKMALQLNSMNEYANRLTTTVPQLNGNVLDVKFSIEEKEVVKEFDGSVLVQKEGQEPIELIKQFDIPIINRWFVSFSTGAFMGLGKSLRPDVYGFRPQPVAGNIGENPTSYELVSTGRRELPLGFATLLNLQYQADREFAFGPSIGVGLSIQDNPRPAYLLGASVMFGHKQQLGFTAGALVTKVNEFKNLNLSGVTYQSSSLPLEYNNVLRQGWFFSVTFTPFEINR